MISDFDQLQSRVTETEREIVYWQEVLQKSEKYERLMQDTDFQELLKDIGQTIDAHKEQIEQCLNGMSEYGPRALADAQHTMFIHQILKEQAELAMTRPKKILELSKEARKKIPMLEDQLKTIKESLHG
jgi:hypothetical protein